MPDSQQPKTPPGSGTEIQQAPPVHLFDAPDAPERTATYARAAGSPGADERDERYELLDPIASGGMGVVYRARDRVMDREVAVKVLRPGLTGTEAARRFFDEARITGLLQHPSIPPVHDLGTLPDGRPFLAMKLIRGKTLAQELKGRAAPGDDLDRFARIFEQVCTAVAFAHAQSVIHRDLKPANIMVGSFSEVQVMDWGLAKNLRAGGPGVPAAEPSVDQPGDGAEDRTRVGQVMGTPAYMPPEQARGENERVDARADVFALGGILCAILTGDPPHVGKVGWIVLRKAADGDLSEAFSRLKGVIDGFAGSAESTVATPLVGLARRCLHPDPAMRPEHASEVLATVRSIQEKARQYQREVELNQAVAEVGSTGRKVRQGLWIALLFGLPVALLGLAVGFIARRPFGDYTAMGVVFVLAFVGLLFFAARARDQ